MQGLGLTSSTKAKPEYQTRKRLRKAVPIKVQIGFVEMENPIQKLTRNLEEPQIAKTGLEDKTWKPTHPNFKSYL